MKRFPFFLTSVLSQLPPRVFLYLLAALSLGIHAGFIAPAHATTEMTVGGFPANCQNLFHKTFSRRIRNLKVLSMDQSNDNFIRLAHQFQKELAKRVEKDPRRSQLDEEHQLELAMDLILEPHLMEALVARMRAKTPQTIQDFQKSVDAYQKEFESSTTGTTRGLNRGELQTYVARMNNNPDLVARVQRLIDAVDVLRKNGMPEEAGSSAILVSYAYAASQGKQNGKEASRFKKTAKKIRPLLAETLKKRGLNGIQTRETLEAIDQAIARSTQDTIARSLLADAITDPENQVEQHTFVATRKDNTHVLQLSMPDALTLQQTLDLENHPNTITFLWSPVCAACKDFLPMFEEVAHQYKDRFRFVQIEILPPQGSSPSPESVQSFLGLFETFGQIATPNLYLGKTLLPDPGQGRAVDYLRMFDLLPDEAPQNVTPEDLHRWSLGNPQ